MMVEESSVSITDKEKISYGDIFSVDFSDDLSNDKCRYGILLGVQYMDHNDDRIYEVIMLVGSDIIWCGYSYEDSTLYELPDQPAYVEEYIMCIRKKMRENCANGVKSPIVPLEIYNEAEGIIKEQ